MAYNLVCDNFNCSRSSDCEFRNCKLCEVTEDCGQCFHCFSKDSCDNKAAFRIQWREYFRVLGREIKNYD